MDKLSEKTNVSTPFATWQQGGKKPYTRPSLVCYGDVRNLTLGGSPGPADSGQNTCSTAQNTCI